MTSKLKILQEKGYIQYGKRRIIIVPIKEGETKLKNKYGLVRMGIIDIAKIVGLDEQVDLIELRLSHNHITEIKGLEHLVNLEKLYLNGNRIKELKGLENLTNLRILNLSSNQISEIMGLEHLVNLEELYLNGNRIKEINGLEDLTNLRVLVLSSNEIVDIGGLENLTNLNDLRLEGNPIYHSLQQIFSSLTSEVVLNFSRMSTEERNVIIKNRERFKAKERTNERNEAIAKARNEALARIELIKREVVERDINSVVYNGKILRIEKLLNGKSKLKNNYGLVRRGIIDIAEIIELDEQVDLIELRLSHNLITEIKGYKT